MSVGPDQQGNVVGQGEAREIVDHLWSIVFDPKPRQSIPVSMEGDVQALELRDSLLQVRGALERARSGRYDYTITSKGVLSGLLKAIQANLRHAAWIAQCIAAGDMTQRMDFLGELSDAFNDMTVQLADMEERLKLDRQRLSIDEERWRLAIECSRDGVFEFDLVGGTQPFFSQRLLEMQRCLPPAPLPDALLSLSRWTELIHPEDTEARSTFWQLAQGTWTADVYDVVFRFARADGELRWRHSRGRAFRDGEGILVRVIGILEDIHSRKEQEDAYIYRATHDGLSGLPNRDFFYQHLDRVRSSWSAGGVAAMLVMIDLDHFKEVNDTRGHPVGDQLLSEFARRLRTSVRDRDVAARFGGDEFALYIACDDDPARQRAIIERIRAALSAPMMLAGQPYDVRCSMGVAVAPKDGVDPNVLMRRADEALYEAKRAGRDTWRSWSPSSAPL